MKRIRTGKVSFIGGTAMEHVSQFSLTAADITALHSAPLTIIKAPGVNKAIQVVRSIFQFKYGSVAFTGGGVISPVYHGATVNLLSGGVAAATVQGTASATISLGAAAAALPLSLNTAVDLYSTVADFAAGNSGAAVTVWYTTYELNQP